MPNVIKKCFCCGKEFVPNRSSLRKFEQGKQKSLTCSIECASQLKRKGSMTKCCNCGKAIYRTPYRMQLRTNQFCSYECEHEYHHKEVYEERFCETCGTAFVCAKISAQRFCSIRCQGKWQSTRIGILNPRAKRTCILCTYCGKEIYVPNYKFKIQNNFFCDINCRKKWYSEVWSQTDEWKQKSKERAIRILEEGLVPTVYTKPQLIVNSILDDAKISYINDYGITHYTIDNYLIDNELMIEVMGNYWHSNPLTFDRSNLSDIQSKNLRRDIAKHTYVKNKYKIEILYLWETDIIQNIDLCAMLVDRYISLGGCLDNYHSFNYKLADDELILNKVIDMPY